MALYSVQQPNESAETIAKAAFEKCGRAWDAVAEAFADWKKNTTAPRARVFLKQQYVDAVAPAIIDLRTKRPPAPPPAPTKVPDISI